MKMTGIHDLKREKFIYSLNFLCTLLNFLKIIFGSKLSGSLKIKIHLDIMQKKKKIIEEPFSPSDSLNWHILSDEFTES